MTVLPYYPATYRHRADVRACQWAGGNEAQILSMGADFDVFDEPSDDDPDATGQLLAGPHNVWTLVYEGDWIVQHPRGWFTRMSRDDFAAEYEPVLS